MFQPIKRAFGTELQNSQKKAIEKSESQTGANNGPRSQTDARATKMAARRVIKFRVENNIGLVTADLTNEPNIRTYDDLLEWCRHRNYCRVIQSGLTFDDMAEDHAFYPSSAHGEDAFMLEGSQLIDRLSMTRYK